MTATYDGSGGGVIGGRTYLVIGQLDVIAVMTLKTPTAEISLIS